MDSDGFAIIDHYPHLSEPKLEQLRLPNSIGCADYPLASLVECMRLVLFVFILTISMSLSQLTASSFGLLADVIWNFDEYFTRLVPQMID